MSTDIDREGDFQIQIREAGVQKYDSGATAIAVIANVLAQFNHETGEWDDWSQYDVVARGYLNIIKKDGTINKSQVESLCKHAGWNGSLAMIAEGEWKPTPCSCNIEANEYKDQVSYRIGFINAFDRVPGGLGTMKPEDAKSLDAQFGSAMRAIAGSATHGNTKPAGKPSSPPSRKGVKDHPYPDPNALDDANAALQAEGQKNRGTAEPADEPEFAK
jgi:hypothetical protein